MIRPRITMRALPLALAIVILLTVGVVALRDYRSLFARPHDDPPMIEFTWTPDGRVSLKEMKALLVMRDDYALDFTTYRMTLVELDKTIDLPIPGLIGKDYEQPISFSLIADDPRLADEKKLTVRISVADDRGQQTTITREIPLK